MKKSLLAILLAVTASSALAESDSPGWGWHEVARTSEAGTYVDTNSVRRDGPLAHAEVVYSLHARPHMVTLAMKFDCASKTFSVVNRAEEPAQTSYGPAVNDGLDISDDSPVLQKAMAYVCYELKNTPATRHRR